MNYPQVLRPTASESVLLPSGETVLVPKAMARFAPWRRPANVNTYGRKQLLEWRKRPAFAELVVLWTLQQEGWQGVWVDSYRSKYRVGLMEESPVDLPPSRRTLLDSLQKRMGRRGGRWDVYCWNDDQVLFIELKRGGRDRIRSSQRLFLETALNQKVPLDAFLIVEWDLGEDEAG